ncbi:uncharacterized protein isoform X2 [Rhodnius prolixus]|uniref:uncharacterized protein isoform X2 n=1 Tax=Rhodnius prolixus TaxID=13249 RepID=UPI003D18D995
MAGLQSCSDISDAKPFYPKRHLYLKPLLKINISIQLPSLKLVGRSISNITLMENIKNWASPDKFCSVKVTKSTLEFIRFEADLLNPSKVNAILARLDGKQVTLPGFKEVVKVRASVAKSDFPTRHDWDSFFRDAKHMNEMKAGERPDTLHLSDLPNKWFSTKSKEDLPSESLLRKIFQQFGEVTAVDIPSVDPYRSKMKAHLSGLKLFNFNQNTTFEAYVQYRDYIAFVKAMDYLRGMKLLKIESNEAFTTNIKVDFDKTKHLSENSIRKRKIEREKLMAKDRELEEKKQKIEDALKKLEVKEKEEEKKITDKQRERKRKLKKLEKGEKKDLEECGHNDESDESKKIVNEKKLLLSAQRKLESIRLLTELLRIIKENKEKISVDVKSNENVKKEENINTKLEVKENLESLKLTLKEKEASELTKGSKEGSRLHSEVVKVSSYSSSSVSRCRRNGNQANNYNNGNTSSRRWRNPSWIRRKMNLGRTNISSNRHYVNPQNTDYYRNTHHLYYKYFQSITRSVPSQSKKSCSHSLSKSPPTDHDSFHSKSTRSRTRSRSRFSQKYSPKFSRRSYSRSLETDSERSYKLSYSKSKKC